MKEVKAYLTATLATMEGNCLNPYMVMELCIMTIFFSQKPDPGVFAKIKHEKAQCIWMIKSVNKDSLNGTSL